MNPETPYVVVDRDILERNLDSMAEQARAKGFALRPHAKTHKMPELAKLQEKYGATGITVATIGEAEVFAKKGIRDIFIAYPLYLTDQKLRKLRKLNRKIRLTLAIDSLAGAKSLSPLGGVRVMVEIDSGHHRSGVLPQEAGKLAQRARKLGLAPVGIFTFPGHSYNPKGRQAAVVQEEAALSIAALSFEEVGVACEVISSGSTPTAKLSKSGLINELRPGVYVFNDAQQWELGSCDKSDIALWVRATVVSASGNKIILDSGSKILGADRASWATGHGRLLDFPDARITALSEHHATVIFETSKSPKPKSLPKIGDTVRVVPNHVCSCVNLVDSVFLESGELITGSWKVAARGKNS
ncbi:MAG: alanine racemase [Actinomycetota bacterium]